jgi:hypothetical protein
MKRKFTVSALIALWLIAAIAVRVRAASFSDEVRGWDYESLMWGAVAGLVGGALRTIFTLASDSRPVFYVLLEARKDMVISLLAGGVAYLILIALASKYPTLVTAEIRMLVIMGAGWARKGFFLRVQQLLTSKLDDVNQKMRNGAPPGAPVPSSKMPLESKDGK